MKRIDHLKLILKESILPGLLYLHGEHKICHNDLKGNNILGKEKGRHGPLVWKLGDFDHAVKFDDFIETPGYYKVTFTY